MKFNNKENPVHIVFKSKFINNIIKLISKIFKRSTRIIWESRSVAINFVLIMTSSKTKIPYVLVSRRGLNAADYRGLFNVVAGYLDQNESGAEAVARETWEEVGFDLSSLFKNKKYIITQNDLNQPWYVKTNPLENRQNVSLRYGLKVIMPRGKFPDLNLENNEVEGEASDPQWMLISEIDNYKWAFGHDQVIKDYLKLSNK